MRRTTSKDWVHGPLRSALSGGTLLQGGDVQGELRDARDDRVPRGLFRPAASAGRTARARASRARRGRAWRGSWRRCSRRRRSWRRGVEEVDGRGARGLARAGRRVVRAGRSVVHC